MSDNESDEGKKRPGRPKKKIIKKEVAHEGIVDKPYNIKEEENNPGMVNVVEVVYDNPNMWKKIFHLFKTMSVENIRVLFDREVIKMYAQDHNENSRVYVKIFGNAINRYYCHEPLEISLKCSNFQKVLHTITKEYGQVIMAINRQNRKSKIDIILANDELDEDGIYSIDTDIIDPYDWSIENSIALEDTYHVKFEIPAKFFKKKVSDNEALCDVFRIEKNGHEGLRFTYTFKDKRGMYEARFKNSGKLNLISTVEEEDLFSTSVYLEHIKPFSGSLISDYINISAHNEHDIIFTAYLDQDEKTYKDYKGQKKKYKMAGTEKCIIKVITNIVRNYT